MNNKPHILVPLISYQCGYRLLNLKLFKHFVNWNKAEIKQMETVFKNQNILIKQIT